MSDTSHNANAGAPVQPSQAHTAAAAHPVGAGRPSASELDTREQKGAAAPPSRAVAREPGKRHSGSRRPNAAGPFNRDGSAVIASIDRK